MGDKNVFDTQNPFFEMASEPRVTRRLLSERIGHAIRNYPDTNISSPYMSFIGLPNSEKCYIFLQVTPPSHLDYENEFRPKRREMLRIACGAAKNKFPHFKKVIGIAIDPIKVRKSVSEDFLLLDCEEWTNEDRREIEKYNKGFKFFESKDKSVQFETTYNFPPSTERSLTKVSKKIGRNEKCPCGSGRKYKKCCGR